MTVKTVFAGSGGQGVLTMGRVWALAAMESGFEVTYLPDHGGQVRGGMVSCTVALGDHEIASPVPSSPDQAAVMNQPSLVRHASTLARGGLLLIDSSQVPEKPRRDHIRVVYCPASRLAQQAGGLKCANMVMLGALAAASGVMAAAPLAAALCRAWPAGRGHLLEMNQKALELGARAVNQTQN